MAITATVPTSANYAPKANIPEGLHQVVVFRVEDLGMVTLSETLIAKNRAQRIKEGGDPKSVKTAVPKARVFFNNAKGQYITRDYNLSLHDKAQLAIDLKRLGKKFDQSFDVETLVGTQGQAMIEEAVSQRGTKYTTIATLAKPATGQNVKARTNAPVEENKTVTVKAAPVADSTIITDDDIPF